MYIVEAIQQEITDLEEIYFWAPHIFPFCANNLALFVRAFSPKRMILASLAIILKSLRWYYSIWDIDICITIAWLIWTECYKNISKTPSYLVLLFLLDSTLRPRNTCEWAVPSSQYLYKCSKECSSEKSKNLKWKRHHNWFTSEH